MVIVSHPETTGSIPACAGEPGENVAVTNTHWVYPRVCGGTLPAAWLHTSVRGLSPRVRGNPGPSCKRELVLPNRVYPRVCGGTDHDHRRREPHTDCGSIPACAGEPGSLSDPEVLPANGSRVYPRVCGGTIPLSLMATSTTGLSPRVRGNLSLMVLVPCISVRSIPACAGEP